LIYEQDEEVVAIKNLAKNREKKREKSRRESEARAGFNPPDIP
jgi:hypothetical protein